MVKLKPLLVVTGTVRVEGGERNQMSTQSEGGGHRTVVQDRVVTKDRKRANVIATAYIRRMRRLHVEKTPYGHLIDPTRKQELFDFLDAATKDAREFNATTKSCKLYNCMVWEVLRGNRQAQIEGWLARCARDGLVKKPLLQQLCLEAP
jgi:hypothetical protein